MEFSVSEIVERTGASYRQIDHWARLGRLGEKNRGTGSGVHRRFSDRDLDVVRALMALSPVYAPMRPSYDAVIAHVRAHGLSGTLELAPGITFDLGALKGAGGLEAPERGGDTGAPTAVTPSACRHPKAQRQVLGYATRCGACGEIVK